MDIVTNNINLLVSVGGILDSISLWFDDLIYSAVAGLYTIFVAFSKLDFRDEFPALDTMASNIFLIVGVFMVFVVTFSLLQYLLDPDKISDKSQGAGAIVKNIIISLVLIVMIQPVFDLLYRAQTAIVNNQVMQRIVQGQSETPAENDSVTLGKQMAYTMWLSFFTSSDGKLCTEDNCGSKITEAVASGVQGKISKAGLSYYMENNNIVYTPFFSCIGGIFVFIMLITFIIQVGVRAFKLLIYEALSPIAIFSYINPSTQSVFKKWLKEVMMTFVDLFIRIAAVLLAIILISNLTNVLSSQQAFNGLTGMTRLIAYFLLIVATLTFAKMIPKLVGDLFGVDLGQTSLNPFKNTILAGATGGVVTSALTGIGGAWKGASERKGVKGKIAGALQGLGSGAARGATSGIKNGPLGGIKSSKDNVSKIGKIQRGRRAKGGMIRSGIGTVKDILSGKERKGAQLSGYQDVNDTIKAKNDYSMKKVLSDLGYKGDSAESDYYADQRKQGKDVKDIKLNLKKLMKEQEKTDDKAKAYTAIINSQLEELGITEKFKDNGINDYEVDTEGKMVENNQEIETTIKREIAKLQEELATEKVESK